MPDDTARIVAVAIGSTVGAPLLRGAVEQAHKLLVALGLATADKPTEAQERPQSE